MSMRAVPSIPALMHAVNKLVEQGNSGASGQFDVQSADGIPSGHA